jgi:LPS export ABC transporter protein LptC
LNISVKKIFRISIPVIFAGILFSCSKPQVIDSSVSLKDLPAESGVDVEILQSEHGRLIMKVAAPKLERYLGDRPYVEFTEGIEIVFYDSLSNPETKMTSGYAISYEGDKILEAKKNVIVVNVKGETLNTEHLIWDQEREIIRTDEHVKITTEDEVITGEGMEADQHFTRYRIKKIKGTINIKHDEDN